MLRAALVGRIATEPETRSAASGVQMARMRVAVRRDHREKDGSVGTDFVDVVAYGQKGTYVCQYCRLGMLIAVEGRLEIRKWKTRSGEPRTDVAVQADYVSALQKAKDPDVRPAEPGQGDYDDDLF